MDKFDESLASDLKLYEALEKQRSEADEKLIADQLDMTLEEMMERDAKTPKFIIPPLKPNQTKGTEKISIRIPRWLLATFRAESARTGKGYQTLMNEKLIQAINITNTLELRAGTEGHR